MSDTFLDLGPIDRLGNLPNENVREGFVNATVSAQPALALTYLMFVINELAAEVNELRSELASNTANEQAKAKPARATKTAEVANESEA